MNSISKAFVAGCIFTNLIWLGAIVIQKHNEMPECIVGQSIPNGGCQISPNRQMMSVLSDHNKENRYFKCEWTNWEKSPQCKDYVYQKQLAKKEVE